MSNYAKIAVLFAAITLCGLSVTMPSSDATTVREAILEFSNKSKDPQTAEELMVFLQPSSGGDKTYQICIKRFDALGMKPIAIIERKLNNENYEIFYGHLISLLKRKYVQYESQLSNTRKNELIGLIIKRIPGPDQIMALNAIKGLKHPELVEYTQSLLGDSNQQIRQGAEFYLISVGAAVPTP